MEKIYLLNGKSSYLLKQIVNKIKDEAKIDQHNIVFFDGPETDIKDVVIELQTVSLFSDLKMVVIDEVDSFVKYDEKELKPFFKYLSNPSDDLLLIMTTNGLPANHYLTTNLEMYAFIENVNDITPKELPSYIDRECKVDGFSIDRDASLELIERTNNNLYLLHQEINKLKSYSESSKNITKQSVISLVPRTVEDNIFAFSSAYLKRDIKSYMQIYEDLLESKMQTTVILNHLFTSMNLILQTKILLDEGFNQSQIATALNMSPGRTYYVMKEAKIQRKRPIEKLIKELANLDYLIKSGGQEDKLGFELLLLGNL